MESGTYEMACGHSRRPRKKQPGAHLGWKCLVRVLPRAVGSRIATLESCPHEGAVGRDAGGHEFKFSELVNGSEPLTAPLSRESFGVEIQSPLNSRKATCLHFFRDQCTWDHFCCPLSGSSQKVRFERGSLRIFEPLNGVFVTSLGTFYKLNRVPVNLLVPLEAGKMKNAISKCSLKRVQTSGLQRIACFPGDPQETLW